MHPSNRYLARSNTLTRGKRVLDSKENEDGQPESKRPKVPALASVIVEALKVDNLQKICSSLEPILRRVVSEEVERALAKLGPARVTGRSSPKRIEGPDGRNLQLHFKTKLSLPLFTGGKIEGDQGAAIHVVLIDANTGQAIYTGPESAVKLDVVVLEGDFNNEDDDNWTQEDFESHVVKEREGKRPLLTGDLQVTLKEGVGTLGDLTFTDNSSWIRSRKFRLGLKVASGYCDGIRIREAKTEAFGVKDHRGELYKKHYPPALKDEVWRLEKIGKDGSFHKRLNKAGINTVEQFLQLVVQNQQKLREILGSGMSNKMWDILVEHAKTCVLSGKHYVYYTDDTRSVGIIFDNIYELRGLIAGDKFYPVESLPDNEKIYVDSMMKKAYDNWTSVIEYDGEVLYKQSSKSASQSRSQITYPNPFEQNVSRSLMPPPMSSDHPPTTHGMIVSGSADSSGHDDNYASNYPPSRILSLHPHSQYENLSFIPENQIVSSSQQIEVANNVGRSQGPSQSSGFEFPHIDHIHQPNLNSSDDWAHQRNNQVDDFFSAEEEIRSRSNEMLANEDMQNLLRVINMNGSSVCMNDDYIYSSYLSSPLPSFTFDEDRSRPSGKAVVGWLKLKAALRWGIFIRKKAAEKRAQLIELDD